jgi:hypothetical protein
MNRIFKVGLFVISLVVSSMLCHSPPEGGEIRVEIITPVLDEIRLFSILDTKVTGFEDMQELNASLYSSSKLEGDLEVDTFELKVFTHSEVA